MSAPPVPPWGLTAPPWSSSAPPQPLPDPGADSPTHTTTPPQTTAAAQAVTAGQSTSAPTRMDAGGTGADGDSGLGILDAPVVPTQRARSALSDQTVVLPSVPAQGGPAGVETGPGWPTAAQPAPTAAQANPAPAQASPGAAQAHFTAAQADPSLAQASPIAAQPNPAAQPAWSPGADPALGPPAAPPPVQQYHHQPPQAPYSQDQHQAPYPGQQYHPAPDAYRPAYVDEGGSTGRNRAALIGAVVAAGVAVVAVAGLGAVMLTRDDPPPTGTAPTAAAPTAAGLPPGDLKLRDDSATITLTWTDPTGGGVPFMVAAGRAGQALGVIATVDPGRTSYTVNGLNSRVDHCFTVLAVYSTDSFATSGQVCTAREREATSSGEPSGRASPR
ncbi:fibronectin type III domain-containing protein [Micromonospora saelicesensis]|uniref:fibronectin type III domain-containing protein n=1 Tax=Micromonospora saelicesensis TaxID=285676 RepID=UPI003CC62837